MSKPNKIFCIAGMHRSGTSLLANWLYNSGIFMGYEFLGPASSNKRGHFEDMEFLNLHCKDLLSKGLDISGFFIEDRSYSFSEQNIEFAHALIEKRRNKELWGWKEPRTTLYLDHWKQFAPQLKVIALIRDKDKTASSLYKRLKKNKWYVTRNPIKKIFWYFEIDLRPKYWLRKFKDIQSIYINRLNDFEKKYPEDILVIKLEELINYPEKVEASIRRLLGFDKPFKPFKTTYQSCLMHV